MSVGFSGGLRYSRKWMQQCIDLHAWIKLSLLTVLAGWGTMAYGYGIGIAGFSNDPNTGEAPIYPPPANCTSCHTGSTFTGYSASISGAGTIAPGSSTSFTFNLTYGGGTAADHAGLDVSVTSGTLTAGSGTRISSTASPDFDFYDGELTHSSPQATSGGSASWSFTYTAPNAVGTVTMYACGNPVHYDGSELDDGPARCTSKTIIINSAPHAADDSLSVDRNSVNNDFTTALNNDTSGSSGNDAGDSISITSVGAASHGTATWINSTTIRYTPVAGYSGPDSFAYTITDASGATSTATINVTVVNHAPAASADAYSLNENATLTVAAGSGVLTNDTDADGDSLSASIVSTVTHGNLTFSGDGSFTYVPDTGYSGADSFTYMASDGDANSTPVTVTLTVNFVNFAPVALGDSYSTSEDTSLTIAASGVLANDTDANNDALSAVLASTTAHGTLLLNGSGGFSYLPAANYNGSDSFTYRASDGSLASNVVTVSINVTPVNDAPVAAADAYSTNEDTALNIAAGAGLLANDTDVDGDALHVSLVSSVSHGVLTLNSNGSFSYMPFANYNGSDSFTYKANDGQADSNVATVSITVVSVNDPPVAAADSYATQEDTALTVAAGSGVLNNDTDADNDALTAMLVSTTAHGTLTLNANGGFLYAPNANYNGSDSFTYRANDGQANSNTVTVSITVTAVNDPPVAVADSYSTLQDTALNVVTGSGVLVNDTDVENDSLTAVIVSSTVHGTLTLNSDGSFSYVPVQRYRGNDSFTYRANDGQASSNTVTVSITVIPVNHAPVADNDGLYTAYENTARTVAAASGVLTNDSDPDDDTLSAVLAGPPAHGTVTLNSNGSFSYVPDNGYLGPDQFSYQASDGALSSAVATVNLITITPPPVITAPADVTLTATGYLTAVDLHATATDAHDGSVAVTSDTRSPLRPGHHVVTYTAKNSSGSTATATQNVDIIPLASLGPDQVTSRGRNVDVEFFINGPAVTYPVTLTYNVSGTATAADATVADGTVTISTGTSAILQIPILDDGGNAADRTLNITLVSATNAVPGANTSSTVTIVDRNIAPMVSLNVMQQSQPRAQVYAVDGLVTIDAQTLDPDAGDSITYDWTGTASALQAPTDGSGSFVLCPVTACNGSAVVVPSGGYAITVTATDSHGASSTRHFTLWVRDTKPVLTTADTDQDHLNDATEGVMDSWNSGLADYLNPFDDSFVIPDRTGSGVTTHALETRPGLSLHIGSMATSGGASGALLATPPADSGYTNASGVFDVEIRGLQQAGGAASIVIPLQSALPANAAYRQYVVSTGNWNNFTSAGSDAIFSAAASNGTCPGPDADGWTSGLSSGTQCIRLTITDGGPNDADGIADGVITSTGGAAFIDTAVATPSPQPAAATKGGGMLGWPLLLALGVLASMMYLRRRQS